MNRQQKRLGAILGLAAMAAFGAWPVWNYFHVKDASARLREQAQAAVAQNPRLQSAWDDAMQDKVLTEPEAEAILAEAGQQAAPGK